MNEIELRYGEISDERRRRIIRICAMTIMQNVDKSDSKLRQNKEGTKEFIVQSETAKKVGIRTAMLEAQFADFIGDYMIENKERYIDLPTYRREDRLIEDMEKMGVIVHIEGVKTKEGHTTQQGEQQATEEEKQAKEKTNDIATKSAIDFAKLNNQDLLLTNRKTGKKEIEYGRYSERKTQTLLFTYQGRQALLKRVGRLTYKTAFMMIADIEEYLIKTPEIEKEVFTYGLNIEKLGKDEQYRRVFFEQLVSAENMNRENSHGYIGSIVDTRDESQYRVDYSEEEYTAVTELKERLAKMRADNDKDDR